jgi:hypothetical protein
MEDGSLVADLEEEFGVGVCFLGVYGVWKWRMDLNTMGL